MTSNRLQTLLKGRQKAVKSRASINDQPAGNHLEINCRQKNATTSRRVKIDLSSAVSSARMKTERTEHTEVTTPACFAQKHYNVQEDYHQHLECQFDTLTQKKQPQNSQKKEQAKVAAAAVRVQRNRNSVITFSNTHQMSQLQSRKVASRLHTNRSPLLQPRNCCEDLTMFKQPSQQSNATQHSRSKTKTDAAVARAAGAKQESTRAQLNNKIRLSLKSCLSPQQQSQVQLNTGRMVEKCVRQVQGLSRNFKTPNGPDLHGSLKTMEAKGVNESSKQMASQCSSSQKTLPKYGLKTQVIGINDVEKASLTHFSSKEKLSQDKNGVQQVDSLVENENKISAVIRNSQIGDHLESSKSSLQPFKAQGDQVGRPISLHKQRTEPNRSSTTTAFTKVPNSLTTSPNILLAKTKHSAVFNATATNSLKQTTGVNTVRMSKKVASQGQLHKVLTSRHSPTNFSAMGRHRASIRTSQREKKIKELISVFNGVFNGSQNQKRKLDSGKSSRTNTVSESGEFNKIKKLPSSMTKLNRLHAMKGGKFGENRGSQQPSGLTLKVLQVEMELSNKGGDEGDDLIRYEDQAELAAMPVQIHNFPSDGADVATLDQSNYIQGVPTLKQGSTQQAPQKLDVLDSFVQCETSIEQSAQKLHSIDSGSKQLKLQNSIAKSLAQTSAKKFQQKVRELEQTVPQQDDKYDESKPLEQRQPQHAFFLKYQQPTNSPINSRNNSSLAAAGVGATKASSYLAFSKKHSTGMFQVQKKILDTMDDKSDEVIDSSIDDASLQADDNVEGIQTSLTEGEQSMDPHIIKLKDNHSELTSKKLLQREKTANAGGSRNMESSAINLSKKPPLKTESTGSIVLKTGNNHFALRNDSLKSYQQYKHHKPITSRATHLQAKDGRNTVLHQESTSLDQQIRLSFYQQKDLVFSKPSMYTLKEPHSQRNSVKNLNQSLFVEETKESKKKKKHNARQEPNSIMTKDGEGNKSAGIFGGLMSRIGEIFSNPDKPAEQSDESNNLVSKSEDVSQVDDVYSAQNPQSPKETISNRNATDGLAQTVDVVNLQLYAPPIKRYGRICDCQKDPTYSMFCTRARNWYEQVNSGTQSLEQNTEAKYFRMKETYKSLAMMQPDEDSVAQIERDLSRTFARHHYFMKSMGGRGHEKLRRVLIAFSNYERQVNYVQGMNFIVAQLLLHCSETFAFWLFVSLIEDCEMRDIYEQELSGLFKHSQMIELLIQANLPVLNSRLQDCHIKPIVFASEWIFGLFASVIPCEYMGDFFDKFFQLKWVFFYQLILTLLKKHEKEIAVEEDFYHFMRQLKVQQYQKSGLPEAANNALVHSSVITNNQIESSILSVHLDKDANQMSMHRSMLLEEIEQQEARLLAQEQPEEVKDPNPRLKKQQSMFGAIKRFLSDQVPWSGPQKQLEVTHPDFWPQIISQCSVDWPQLEHQPAIPRLLRGFDTARMTFNERVPWNDSQAIQEYLWTP